MDHFGSAMAESSSSPFLVIAERSKEEAASAEDSRSFEIRDNV